MFLFRRVVSEVGPTSFAPTAQIDGQTSRERLRRRSPLILFRGLADRLSDRSISRPTIQRSQSSGLSRMADYMSNLLPAGPARALCTSTLLAV